MIPESIELTPSFEPHLLGGVVVPRGIALSAVGRDAHTAQLPAVDAPPAHDWGPELCRTSEPTEPAPPATSDTVPITLVPYFAWTNRGISSMEVWMPLPDWPRTPRSVRTPGVTERNLLTRCVLGGIGSPRPVVVVGIHAHRAYRSPVGGPSGSL